MKLTDLDLIFIRAQDQNGNWNSLSLRELMDMGQHGQQQVASWLIDKLVIGIFRFKQGQKMDDATTIACIEKLDALGIPIVRINPELLKVTKLNDPIAEMTEKKAKK